MRLLDRRALDQGIPDDGSNAETETISLTRHLQAALIQANEWSR
ncbi:hypothetical protein [Nevskia sp.]|nr:hypothetical protein [Nevskia sp.]